MRGNEKVSHWFRRAHMAWDSSIVALAICLITVLWSRCVVCDSRKSGWRLFVSMKPLQPTWMVCRLACLPPFCATSNRWRYLLSFLSRELRKLFSQQIVSSKMCRRPHTHKHTHTHTHTPTVQENAQNHLQTSQQAGTITYIKFADSCGYCRLRSCSFQQTQMSSGHATIYANDFKAKSCALSFSTLQALAKP